MQRNTLVWARLGGGERWIRGKCAKRRKYTQKRRKRRKRNNRRARGVTPLSPGPGRASRAVCQAVKHRAPGPVYSRSRRCRRQPTRSSSSSSSSPVRVSSRWVVVLCGLQAHRFPISPTQNLQNCWIYPTEQQIHPTINRPEP